MKKITHGRHFGLFFFILLTLLSSGCDEGSKWTAEEAGYLEEVSEVLNLACSVGTVDTYYETDPFSMNQQPQAKSRVIESMGTKNWAPVRDHFLQIIPPSTLTDLHSRIVSTIESQESFNSTNTGEAKAELARSAALVREERAAFDLAVKNRPIQKVTGDEWSVTYKPPLVPLEGAYSSNSGFTLEVNPSLDTPVGSFGMKMKEGRGVKKLVIRSEERERYLKLDRPFRLFIPTDYGVEVSGDGSGTMIIEVKKESDH